MDRFSDTRIDFFLARRYPAGYAGARQKKRPDRGRGSAGEKGILCGGD
jgi:hypothetical protein